IDASFCRRLGRNPPNLLELPNGTVGLTTLHFPIHQLETRREIGWGDGEYALQRLLTSRERGAVGALRVQLGECVEHPSVVGGVALEFLENGARAGGSPLEGRELRLHKPNVGTPGIELARPAELLFGIVVSAQLQI